MQNLKYFLLHSFLAITIAAIQPSTKHYYISQNNVTCSVISLSAYVSVVYETNLENQTIYLSFENASNSNRGICGDVGWNFTEFNISFNDNEVLSFNFFQIDNYVILKQISFVYRLPSIYFPNATTKGTIVATYDTNRTLSTTSEFYECLAYTEVNLTNGVTLHIFGIKLKIFNVKNGSYGDEGSFCPQSNGSTTTDPPSSTTTSTGKSTHSDSPITSPVKTTSLTTTSISPTTPPRNYSDPKFAIKDGPKVCLLLQGRMTLSVEYRTNKKIQFPVSNSSYNGSCGQIFERININVNENCNFSLLFNKTKAIAKLYKLAVQIILPPSLLSNEKDPSKVNIANFDLDYEADVGSEYFCNRKLMFGNTTLHLELMNFKFEAFRNSSDTEFSNKLSGSCPVPGMSIGQLLAIILFSVMVSLILGLSVISLIKKCARYYHYKKVNLQEPA